MRGALVVAKWEFWCTVRRKEYILATVLTPIFALLVFSLPSLLVEHGGGVYTVGYVDRTGMFELPGSASSGMAGRSGESYVFVRYSSEQEAERELLAGELSMYMVIPEDYMETGRVEVYTTRTLPLLPVDVISQSLVRQMLEGRVEDERLVERASKPVELRVYRLDERGESRMNLASYMAPVATGMLLMLALVISSGFLVHSMNEERESRMLEVLLSSASAEQVVAGKLLGLGSAGLLQMLAWLGMLLPVAIVLAAEVEPQMLLLVLGYFLLGFLLYASIMLGVGAVCSSPREAQQLMGVLVLSAVLPLAFGFIIFQNTESTAARAVSLFPLTAPVSMVYRSSMGGVPPGELVLSAVLLLASAALTLKLSARLLMAGMLMRGKGMTEVLKSLLTPKDLY